MPLNPSIFAATCPVSHVDSASVRGAEYLRRIPLAPGRPPTTSIDLSKAIKLKEVAFRFNRLHVIWVTESLKTITTEHNDLQQISIYIPFCLDKFFGRLAARASGTHQQWKELDKVLVQLWESRAIHAKVICNAKERRREDMCEFIEGRLPEMRRKRGIQVVYPVPPACA